MIVKCDGCGTESKEFFSIEADPDVVVTFEEGAVATNVDFADPRSFVLTPLPTGKADNGDRELDWKYLCPECLDSLRRWLEGRKIDDPRKSRER